MMNKPVKELGIIDSGMILTLTSSLALFLLVSLSACGGSVAKSPPPPPPSNDTTPPTASLTAPSSGATVSGTITVSADASDNVAVAGVQFKVDGSNIGAEDTTAPYSVSWNTNGVANGSHTLTAVARDTSNNSATSAGVSVTVDNSSSSDTTPPTATITAPSSGATVSGTITVSANASDNVAVAGVQFKVDGSNIGAEDTTAPYSVSWNTNGVADGSHTLTAVARDTSNNSATSASVSVTVNNSTSSDTTPPTVTITAPSSGATVSGTITVSANASDNVAVAGVQFQVDGSNTGSEDTSAPYSISLNTTSLTNGNHTLAAVARDTSNNTTTSSGVTISVDNQSGSTFSATITLQPAQTKQTWIAWRGTAQGPIYGTTQSDDVPPAAMSAILDTLANDLGLNGFRYEFKQQWANYEATNDNSDPNNLNQSAFFTEFDAPFTSSNSGSLFDMRRLMNEVVLPLRSRVLANGETFSLYTSIVGGYSQFQPHWHNNSQEFAEFAEAIVLWIQTNWGFVPDYFVLVNEPATAWWTTSPPNEIIGHVVATGSRFASRGWSTTIQFDENVVPSDIWKVDACDAQCRSFVGLLSFHGYDYNSSLMPGSFGTRNDRRNRAQTWGVPTALTEICCKSGWKGSFDHGLQLARDIYWNLTEADISIWEPLGTVQPCGSAGCPSGSSDILSIEPGTYDKLYKLPHYYAQRQFMRWIRPGYVRVDTTCSGCTSDPNTGLNVKTVTFKRPDGSYVIVAINDQDNSASLTLSGFPGGTYQIEGVDPTVCTDPPGGAGVQDRCTPTAFASQTISTGQDLVLTLPARSIVTFH